MKLKVNQFDEKVDVLKGYMSAVDVAKKLRVSPRRVRKLIQDGSLTAIKVGNMWLITAQSVEAYKPRKVGKPPENK